MSSRTKCPDCIRSGEKWHASPFWVESCRLLSDNWTRGICAIYVYFAVKAPREESRAKPLKMVAAQSRSVAQTILAIRCEHPPLSKTCFDHGAFAPLNFPTTPYITCPSIFHLLYYHTNHTLRFIATCWPGKMKNDPSAE